MDPQYAKDYPDFITVTCLQWKHLLTGNRFKDIIMKSLLFLVKDRRITLYAFVIMNNHFHLIWHMMGDRKREDVQRDFLKFTSQRIVDSLRKEKSSMLDELLVNAKDRKYQVWERNSLSIPIWSRSVMYQKLAYIHENPVRAGLCKLETDYLYSSARFYFDGDLKWRFLVHVEG
jgi:REP element-mobilizing transposase RayT